MNLHDQHLRLLDLEIALIALARGLANVGGAEVLQQAIRKVRVEGAKGAEDLLRGDRASAAYRRA